MLALFAAALIAGPLVNLESLGVYSEELTLFQWGEDVLLCQRKQNLLLRLDKNWKVIGRFEAAGPGPEELDRPIVLAVMPSKVLILNGFRTVLALDGNLQPTGEQYPPFPSISNFQFGISRGSGKILVIDMGTGPFGVWETVVADGQWKRVASLMPRPDGNIFNPWTRAYQDGFLFVSDSPFRDFRMGSDPADIKNPDFYKVKVFDISERLEENLVLALSHSVEGLEGFDDKIMYSSSAFRWQQRYYVLVMFFDHRDLSFLIQYLDTFAENGDFLGRSRVPSHWRYMPIHGGPGIIQLNHETMELFAFNPP